MPAEEASSQEFAWDIFISHASEDKEDIARPLALLLRKAGLRVWFDETVLKIGDSLNESIANGLRRSRYGLVILSPHFIGKKKWTAYEINALFSLEDPERTRILPVIHKLKQIDVVNFNPTLADRVSVSTSKGIEAVAEAVVSRFRTGPDTFAPRSTENEASDRVIQLSRTLDLIIKILETSEIGLEVPPHVLHGYRYSHRHLIDSLERENKDSLGMVEKIIDRAIGDVFDALILHMSERISVLRTAPSNMTAENRAILAAAMRRLTTYKDNIVAVGAGRAKLPGAALLATITDAVETLSLVSNLNPAANSRNGPDALVHRAIVAAKKILGYLS